MTSTKGVLIVEDEAFIAMELEMELEKAGFNVLKKLARGEDVLEYVKKLKPEIILMDINLAGHMSGIEAAREIKEKYAIPIIFMTGYQDETMMSSLLEMDPVATLVKPINFHLLKMSMDSVFPPK